MIAISVPETKGVWPLLSKADDVVQGIGQNPGKSGEIP